MKTTSFSAQEVKVTVFESALYRTNTTMLEWADAVLLTDPNWLPDEVDYIRRTVYERLNDRELWLFFTHSDYDHILGVGAFPGAKVLASAAFARHPDPKGAVQQVVDWDQQHYIQRDYPLFYPRPDKAPEQPAEEVQLAGRSFLSWPAPGHTEDGLILLDVASGVLLVGDYLSNVEFPFVYHSLRAYHDTLNAFEEIVRRYAPALLVPGHGDPTDQVSEMHRRIEESRAYLSDLTDSVGAAASFPLDDWLARYPFPAGLAEEHAKNSLLASRELGA